MKFYCWDIETTCIEDDDGEEIQVTFLSNVLDFDLSTGYFTSKFFRTIEETREYFRSIDEGYVYVHNLNYELTFLLRDMEEVKFCTRRNKKGEYIKDIYGQYVSDIVFRDKNSPLHVRFEEFPQLVFRDSYALFNKSVKDLGNDLIKRGMNLPKLDYDYKKIRLPWDKLEEIDYKYNQRDNEIVAYSIYFYMRDNGYVDIEELPLTFTSAIRRQRHNFIVKNFGKKEEMNYHFEQARQLKDFDFFNLCVGVYQGGLTTSNINQTNKFIERDMYSIDIKSSYPFQMSTRKFPLYHTELVEHYKGEEANKVYHTRKGIYYIGVFNFVNLRVKDDRFLLPISTSQFKSWNGSLVEQNIKCFNGKVISADTLNLPVNDIDMEVIDMIYDYDYCYCLELYTTYKRRYLPKSEVCFLLNLFTIKESKPKETLEYIQSKQAINGQYGIKVTSPIRSNFFYDEKEEKIGEIDYFKIYDEEEKRRVYNNYVSRETLNNNSLDIYTDGIYITSYARLMLIKKSVELIKMGATVVYSDTDSLKFYADNIEKIKETLERENDIQIRRNKNALRFKQYKELFNVEEKIYNKISKLGIWELENFDNPYQIFVTYGAKKYAYIDNEGCHITIAGCNKYKPIEAIKNRAKLLDEDIKLTFKSILQPNTCFAEGVSGRTLSIVEKRKKSELYHITYQGRKINQYGGIIIKDTTYTLNMSKNDSALLGHEYQDEVSLTLFSDGEVE